jgi:scyllo-inositol 2-dehydrogenase (NADP+)
MLNVGLVGFGFAGRTFHAPIISNVPGLRLQAIVERSSDNATKLYPETKIYRSLGELLSDKNVNVVVIATPNQTHSEFASQCLNEGRHVVVDKPFTTTSKEARELIALAQSRGKILTVYQNRRWDGDFLTVQQLIGDRLLGRPVQFESHFDRFRPELREGAWREQNEPGSGVLFDLGPHLIDQAMLLFGPPEAIQADVRIERSGALVDDAFDITFFYPTSRALLRATMLAKTSGPRFIIHGVDGSFVKHGMDPQEDALKEGRKPSGHDWGIESEDNWGILELAASQTRRRMPTIAGDYRKFYENLRDSIEKDMPLAVTPTQALNVMVALELCQQSSRNGCRVPWPV